MVPVSDVPALLRETIFEWHNTRLADLLFARRGTAVLTIVVLIGLTLGMAIVRATTRRKAGRTQVALPAVLQWTRPSWVSMVRHGALLLFLAGLPFFAVALADPYTTFTRQDVSYPGRRIAVMIDASSSMLQNFPTQTLGRKASKGSPPPAVFMTTVSAAETFVRQRVG